MLNFEAVFLKCLKMANDIISNAKSIWVINLKFSV